MRIVVFTGAGAPKADGAPLQTELFQEFFSRAALPASRAQLAKDVTQFFETVFGVDPRSTPGATLPTFEKCLLLRAGGWTPIASWTDPQESFSLILATQGAAR